MTIEINYNVISNKKLINVPKAVKGNTNLIVLLNCGGDRDICIGRNEMVMKFCLLRKKWSNLSMTLAR